MQVPCMHSLCAAHRHGAGGPRPWWAGLSAMACARATGIGAASQQQCLSPWTSTQALARAQHRAACIRPQSASL